MEIILDSITGRVIVGLLNEIPAVPPPFGGITMMPTASLSLAASTDRLPLLPLKRKASGRFSGRGEPSIDELMGDPIFDRLLASDGLGQDHLRQMIADARAKLAGRRR